METLTHWLTYDVLGTGNTPVHLAGFAGAIFATLLAARLLTYVAEVQLRRLAEKSETELDDVMIDALKKPATLLLLAGGIKAASLCLVLPGDLEGFVDHVVTVVITVFLAWGLTRAQDAFVAVIVEPWVAKTETKLDDLIVPIVDKTFKFVIWTMAILTAFSVLGYDVLSLLTGLGIGGVAVAMAAQATLSNVFGSISIFADQPFHVDDLVEISGQKGIVTEVGLRTIRMRTFEGNLVTIPNSLVVNQPVINRSPTGQWRYDAKIGLVYGTNAATVRAAMAAIGEILEAHPAILDNYAVRFTAFGESAQELTYAYYMQEPAIGAYLDAISEVNLAIKACFEERGYEMAFPSLSLYVEGAPTSTTLAAHG